MRLLVVTSPVRVESVACAEKNTRKVGIVTILNADPTTSPLQKRLVDLIRAAVPDLNVTFEFRSSDRRNDHYPRLISDLVEKKVDVILAFPGPAALAARQVTTEIPVVFMIAANPVTLGLVESLDKPGGNMTGLYEELLDFQSARVALLKEMVPEAKTIGILWDAGAWDEHVGGEMAQRTEKAVLATGARAVIMPVRGADDLERSFALLKQAQVDGLVVEQGPAFILHAKKLAHFAAEVQLPTIYPLSIYTEAGGLASLGPDLATNYLHIARYIGLILRGASSAELPVEGSEKIYVTVNAAAANHLGIAIPPKVLARANKIE